MFDRFDICEAYYALEMEWNVSGFLPGRDRQVGGQLNRMGFSVGRGFNGYESLSDNGQLIYDNYLHKMGWPSVWQEEG